MVIILFTYVVACTSHYIFPSIYSQQGSKVPRIIFHFDSFSFQLLVVPLHPCLDRDVSFGCSAYKFDFFTGFREAEVVHPSLTFIFSLGSEKLRRCITFDLKSDQLGAPNNSR